MVKKFCDICGAEKKNLLVFNYLCHLDNRAKIKGSYIDDVGSVVSAQEVRVELCSSCYETVVIDAVVSIGKLKQHYNAQTYRDELEKKMRTPTYPEYREEYIGGIYRGIPPVSTLSGLKVDSVITDDLPDGGY